MGENKNNIWKTDWVRMFGMFLAFLVAVLAILLRGDDIGFYNGTYFSSRDGEITGTAIVEVTDIIDGDTVEVKHVDTGEVFKVRYLGIDTPEFDGLGYETCFADEAKERNEELLSDEKVKLEFDRDKHDQYGRTLAYVYTLNADGEKDIFVNLNLLEEGYGRFYLDKQNITYQEELIGATDG